MAVGQGIVSGVILAPYKKKRPTSLDPPKCLDVSKLKKKDIKISCQESLNNKLLDISTVSDKTDDISGKTKACVYSAWDCQEEF